MAGNPYNHNLRVGMRSLLTSCRPGRSRSGGNAPWNHGSGLVSKWVDTNDVERITVVSKFRAPDGGTLPEKQQKYSASNGAHGAPELHGTRPSLADEVLLRFRTVLRSHE